jgi:hypothetical protein
MGLCPMGIQQLGKEVRFLVPMVRNSDRELHEITKWEWLKEQMYVEFPEGWQRRHYLRTGSTIYGTVEGHWFDRVKKLGVPDECVEFIVAILPERMPDLEKLFDSICLEFDQKCIYFTNGEEAALYFPSKTGAD